MTDPLLLIHIITGGAGIISGFIALYSAKGAALHRRSGMVFVYTMLTMAILGAGIAALRDKSPASNVPVGVLTAYMVFTALTTVHALPSGFRWLDRAGLLAALVVGLALLTFGVEALASADGARYGVPAFPYFLFATIALVASAGDVRVIRTGALRGAPRIARHLWRMCFALALGAFSFGPRLARLVPKPFRMTAVFLLPTVVVLLTMAYWLWRVRAKRSSRSVAILAAPEAAR